MAARIWPVASIGSAASPSARVNTFAFPPGNRGQRGQVAGRGGGLLPVRPAHQAVDRLVHRAVPAERDHQVVALLYRARRERDRVAPVACFHDLQVDLGRQRPHDHVPPQRGRGGGMGVNDQQRAHWPQGSDAGREAKHAGSSRRPVGAAGAQAAEAAGVFIASVLSAMDTATGKSYQLASGIALTVIGFGTAVALAVIAAGAGPGAVVEQDSGPAQPAVHPHRGDLPAAGAPGGVGRACRGRLPSRCSSRCCCRRPSSCSGASRAGRRPPLPRRPRPSACRPARPPPAARRPPAAGKTAPRGKPAPRGSAGPASLVLGQALA